MDVASYDEEGGRALEAAVEAAKALPSDGWLQRVAEEAPFGPIEMLLGEVRGTVYARAKAQEAGKGPADDAEWERWWREPAAADVTYVEFMGKDNVPFHTVGFPCTLFGINEKLGADGTFTPANNAPWKLVDQLKGFNWLDYYGGKFSTSQNRGVFMDQALEILPADYWL